MIRGSGSSSRVMIACGGTGGHLFPGLAVAEELVAEGVDVTLMISPKEVDQRAVRDVRNIQVATLPSVALQRGSRLAFFRHVTSSVCLCLREFRRCRPAAVLAMGGFTSAGPVLAARLMHTPVFLHESNTIPGRANRLLSRFARTVFIGFPSAAKRFRCKTHFSGMPVRRQFGVMDVGECRRVMGLDPDRPVVLVAGGSQGAKAINQTVMRAIPGACSMLPHWQWLHLTGPEDELQVREAYRAVNVNAVVHGFWDQMEFALGAASVAVMRSGASSMAELAALRVPAALIPYPYAADDHQFHNACAFESVGAAVLVEQDDLKPEYLLAALRPMVEDALVRERMQKALGMLHRPDSARHITAQILGRPIISAVEKDVLMAERTPLNRRKALVA